MDGRSDIEIAAGESLAGVMDGADCARCNGVGRVLSERWDVEEWVECRRCEGSGTEPLKLPLARLGNGDYTVDIEE